MNSKKKHNINYIKPAEPAFITRMKIAAGYVEGPNVDTKKAELPKFTDEDGEDKEDEKPTVVVMNDGDLTQEEADLLTTVKKQAEKVEKADLTLKVTFKRKNTEKTDSAKSSNPKEVKRRNKDKPKKSLLSFDDEEEE
ncbi:uncharacterized protein KIAA1143 homolog [Phymastichus coffea]|uniref:uncharacterized protein KIAA1143 homolog n=1 Tax=Phymastichus coffea TaxID=108790 RepID=UPI00273B6064|nr:uncharacterized protein KIAA1143 homolog [Phymastichus coffea]